MQDETWDKGHLARWFNETPPFSGLPPEDLEDLLDVSVECSYQAGELILQQRSTDHPFLGGVLTGEVRLYDDVTHMLEVPCFAGSLFGAAGLLRGGALPYNVVASLPTTCVRIPAFIIERFCESHESFAKLFLDQFVDVPDLPAVGTWVGGAQMRPIAALSQIQGAQSWGRLLTAGLSDLAIAWLQRQSTDHWTILGLTPEETRKQSDVHGKHQREGDRFLTATFDSSLFLEGESFDVTVVDYRDGAIAVSAPRSQRQLFARLRAFTSQRLFLVGSEPDEADSESLPNQVVQEVARMRDVCFTLAYHYPHLTLSSEAAGLALGEAGFVVENIAHAPRQLDIAALHMVLNQCLCALPKIPDTQLALALAHSIRDLRERARAVSELRWGVQHSTDYLVVARPA